nr:RNA-directed DNA polymerase, eukaryota [Tanacetum cinerariifolium]
MAFIKGRQILNGPLMLNEIVGWSKAKKKQNMVFKVDFKKAYDSLSWEYLFEGTKTLSIREILTLIKSILESSRSYFMSLFPAPTTVLRDLEVGAHLGLWTGIILALRQLKDRGDGLQDFFQTRAISVAKRLGICWFTSSLRREPRGGVETKQWEAISTLIKAFVISPRQDKLRRTLDSYDEFRVSSARYFLDDHSLFSRGNLTRWNNFVLIKLNILLCRIGLARILTRDNLVSRGIVLDSSLYLGGHKDSNPEQGCQTQ